MLTSTDAAYPVLARTLAARRDNLRATIALLERRFTKVQEGAEKILSRAKRGTEGPFDGHRFSLLASQAGKAVASPGSTGRGAGRCSPIGFVMAQNEAGEPLLCILHVIFLSLK